MARAQQSERRRQIEKAAFEVLEQVGFRKASMLQIAKRARASNETLYAWYGNKQELFSSMIADNAGAVKTRLQEAIDGHDDPAHSLAAIGMLLLQFTATEKAVIMNRAAVADVTETGLLAAAIQTNARAGMLDLLRNLMAQLERQGVYSFDGHTDQAVHVFIGLLIGELQLQQALGAHPPLTDSDIEARTMEALHLFDRLYKCQEPE